jgi:hypothetical protein
MGGVGGCCVCVCSVCVRQRSASQMGAGRVVAWSAEEACCMPVLPSDPACNTAQPSADRDSSAWLPSISMQNKSSTTISSTSISNTSRPRTLMVAGRLHTAVAVPTPQRQYWVPARRRPCWALGPSWAWDRPGATLEEARTALQARRRCRRRTQLSRCALFFFRNRAGVSAYAGV